MKAVRNLAAFALIFLFSPGLGAQDSLPCYTTQSLSAAELRELAAAQEIQRQELVNLEKETAHALQQNSSSFFRRVYSDDYLGTVASGQLIDKETLVNAVEASNIKYASFIATDIRVRIFQDTAVVTALWSARGNFNGRNFDRQYRVVHVYIYSQHGWKAVSSQETMLPG